MSNEYAAAAMAFRAAVLTRYSSLVPWLAFPHAFLRKWAPRRHRGRRSHAVRQSGNAVQVAVRHRAREALRRGARAAHEPRREGGAKPRLRHRGAERRLAEDRPRSLAAADAA